jgi:hypothetical protein
MPEDGQKFQHTLFSCREVLGKASDKRLLQC